MKALKVTSANAQAYRRWLLARQGMSGQAILRREAAEAQPARVLPVQPWFSSIDQVPITRP